MADEYGVSRDIAWAAVVLHGCSLVDERSVLAATGEQRTIYATGPA